MVEVRVSFLLKAANRAIVFVNLSSVSQALHASDVGKYLLQVDAWLGEWLSTYCNCGSTASPRCHF